MKEVVFIGNRMNALSVLLEKRNVFNLKKVFILEDSILHKEEKKLSLNSEIFQATKLFKDKILDYLFHNEFDLLISNGCPFIIPISALKHKYPSALFINTHPTYLPFLRGKTPLNGVFIMGYDFIGATTHYMDDGIDAGNIIYQEKVDLTSDIDQGLIYHISFDLENLVFRKSIQILIESNFIYEGSKQSRPGSYFNRDENVFHVEFDIDSTDLICKKINSMGMTTRPNKINLINNGSFDLHEAVKIENEYLLNKYMSRMPGDLILRYSNKLLIKTIDGIVKASYV